jgi:hypothetical protein
MVAFRFGWQLAVKQVYHCFESTFGFCKVQVCERAFQNRMTVYLIFSNNFNYD